MKLLLRKKPVPPPCKTVTPERDEIKRVLRARHPHGASVTQIATDLKSRGIVTNAHRVSRVLHEMQGDVWTDRFGPTNSLHFYLSQPRILNRHVSGIMWSLEQWYGESLPHFEDYMETSDGNYTRKQSQAPRTRTA